MAEETVGLLHPGEMGAALGAALVTRGVDVLWASSDRSPASADRARRAGLRDVGSVREVAARSELLLSVCPPHAAVDVAHAVAGFSGVYVDANAVSPATSRAIGALVEAGGGRYVDGGIVGPPPGERLATRLYLAGGHAQAAVDLFAGTPVEAHVVSDTIGAASALKMAYAAWTKGTAALLLVIRALARVEDVEPALLAEWRGSIPGLAEDSLSAARAGSTKGWRWVGEMEEIAATFAAQGLPDGFHLAAADVYRRAPRLDDAAADERTLDRVLDALR